MPRRVKNAPSIYVGGLGKDTREEELQKIFEKYGKIEDVYIPKDYYSRENRGFAYVQFHEEDDAYDAFDNVGPVEVRGRQLSVEWAKGARKTPDQMRGREPRSGHDSRGSSRRNRSRSRSRSRGRYQSRSRSPSRSRRDYRGRRSSRSRSPVRRYSRSPRRYSRSPVRRYSRSPRRYSRSPVRRYSRSPRRYSRSPVRRYTRSRSPSRSRSPVRRYSRSRSRSRSASRPRSPVQEKSELSGQEHIAGWATNGDTPSEHPPLNSQADASVQPMTED